MRIAAILIALTLVFMPLASSEGWCAEPMWHPYVLVYDAAEKTSTLYADDKTEGYPTQEACDVRAEEMGQAQVLVLLMEQKDPMGVHHRCSTNDEAEETEFVMKLLGGTPKLPGQEI